mgnify:CR=1 FL=1
MSFKALLEKAKKHDGYWVEKAKLNFSTELNKIFTNKGITQKELATKLNTSPAYITKVFRGDANFTIETMIKLSRAVESELHIQIKPKQVRDWAEIAATRQPHESNDEWLSVREQSHEHTHYAN